MTDLSPLSPPERLLCGPGPSNVHPRVLAAMRKPMVSHLDPAFHEMLDSIVELLAAVYRRDDGMSIALSASGTSGMEAGITALTEPGDTVIVASAGFFAARIADMAARHGARVIELTAPLGSTVDNDRILDELAHHPETKLVTVVHAETSTGACHPLAELAEAVSGTDALLMADCVTSLGGIELETSAWGVDYAFSCTQKCLGAPPGISPLSLSERALQRIQSRRAPMPFSFDLELLRRYWIERPAVYHHTMPILSYYALHEALRLALEEGLQERWERHAQAGAYLQAELRERGYELLAEPDVQLPQLTAVRVPEGVDGRAVQATLLAERGIEIGGGLGPSAPPIWRIGLMGTNATTDAAALVLEGLDAAVPARALTGSAA